MEHVDAGVAGGTYVTCVAVYDGIDNCDVAVVWGDVTGVVDVDVVGCDDVSVGVVVGDVAGYDGVDMVCGVVSVLCWTGRCWLWCRCWWGYVAARSGVDDDRCCWCCCCCGCCY